MPKLPHSQSGMQNAAKTLTADMLMAEVRRPITRRLGVGCADVFSVLPETLISIKNPNFIVLHDSLKLWVLGKLRHVSPHDSVLYGVKLASVTCVSSEIGLKPTFLWTFHFLQTSNGFWIQDTFLTGALCVRSADQWPWSMPAFRTFSLPFWSGLSTVPHSGWGSMHFTQVMTPVLCLARLQMERGS